MEYCDPLKDNVLVSPDEFKSANSQLVLPENSKDKLVSFKGLAIAVGPDCKRVKKGDHVVYDMRKGLAFTMNKKPHAILAEEHVLGILSEQSVLKN